MIAHFTPRSPSPFCRAGIPMPAGPLPFLVAQVCNLRRRRSRPLLLSCLFRCFGSLLPKVTWPFAVRRRSRRFVSSCLGGSAVRRCCPGGAAAPYCLCVFVACPPAVRRSLWGFERGAVAHLSGFRRERTFPPPPSALNPDSVTRQYPPASDKTSAGAARTEHGGFAVRLPRGFERGAVAPLSGFRREGTFPAPRTAHNPGPTTRHNLTASDKTPGGPARTREGVWGTADTSPSRVPVQGNCGCAAVPPALAASYTVTYSRAADSHP